MEHYSPILHKIMGGGGGGGGNSQVSRIGDYNKPVSTIGNTNRVIKVLGVAHHNGSKHKHIYV